MKKYLIVFAVIVSLSFGSVASAQSVTDLQAQIQTLLTQIEKLKVEISNKNLKPLSVDYKPVGPVVTSGETVSEQVTCVFNGTDATQKCYTAAYEQTLAADASCSGVGACVADVKGTAGRSLTWKSTCGGFIETQIDGKSEHITFACSDTDADNGTSGSNTNDSGYSLVLKTPTTGDTWKVGESYNVQWSSEGRLGKKTVYITNVTDYENKTIQYLGTTQGNSLRYKVPASLKPGKYMLMVCGENYCPARGGSSSAIIAIGSVGPTQPVDTTLHPKIVVTSPNGGESFKPGKSMKVEWKGGNPNSTVSISLVQLNQYNLAINYGVPVLTQLATTKNDGSEEVKIPSKIREGRYFVLVESPRSSNNQINMDYSNKQFVITKAKEVGETLADVNNDGRVTTEDKEIVGENYGECSKFVVSDIVPRNYCHEDLDSNGVVNDRDVEIVNRYLR